MNELSLYSGYCGWTIALRLAGIPTRTVAYCDNDPYAQAIIQARIKDGLLDDAPIWGDIHTLDGRELAGVVGIITAGFPCQPHSVAGQRKGAGDERDLWPETRRVVGEVGPRYVALENVPGIMAGGADGARPYVWRVVSDLRALGYVGRAGVVGAWEAGAPHRRDRWWCLAWRPGQRLMADAPSRGQATVGGKHQEMGRAEQPDADGREGLLADAGWIGGGARRPEPSHRQQGRSRPEHAGGAGRVADAEGERPPPRGAAYQRTGGPGGAGLAGEPVADATSGDAQQPSGERSVARETPRGWACREPSGSSVGVDDAERAQRRAQAEGRGFGRDGGEQGQHGPWQEAGGPGEPGGDVGDAGRQQEFLQRRGIQGQPPGASLPLWPPGPRDYDAWARVLRDRPDLAPALSIAEEDAYGVSYGFASRGQVAPSQAQPSLHGVAHEPAGRLGGRVTASRARQLRALGNGICPIAAALALRRLMEEM